MPWRWWQRGCSSCMRPQQEPADEKEALAKRHDLLRARKARLGADSSWESRQGCRPRWAFLVFFFLGACLRIFARSSQKVLFEVAKGAVTSSSMAQGAICGEICHEGLDPGIMCGDEMRETNLAARRALPDPRGSPLDAILSADCEGNASSQEAAQNALSQRIQGSIAVWPPSCCVWSGLLMSPQHAIPSALTMSFLADLHRADSV